MVNIVLEDDQLRFDQGSLNYVVDRDIIRTQSGVLRFNSNTSARRVFRGRLFSTTAAEKGYLRGVVEAAYYNNDSIEFTLPPEVARYNGTAINADGTPTATIQVQTAAAAGSNVVTLRVGTSGSSRPGGTALIQGDFVQFGTDPTIYNINSYTSSSGRLTFHPVLREPITAATNISYHAVTFRGHITNNISEEFFQSNNDALRIPLVIEETLG